MSGPDDDSEKSHEATPKKLEDARKKGEVVRSADLSTAAGYGGLLLVAAAFGGASLRAMGDILSNLIVHASPLSEQAIDGAPSATFGAILLALVPWLAPWFAVPAVAVIAVVIAQRAFLVTPSKLAPKLSRISPLANAKQKFGRNGLFEFFKSFAKLAIYSICLGLFLRARSSEMFAAMLGSPEMASALLMRLCVEFMFLVLAIALTLGAIDWFWQRQEHLRKNRMSHKDLTDESKESEGDPHMKSERRQRGQKIAMTQMMKDVPTADVVIVNPTHYAVALKWSRAPGEAPKCVAKGVDEIARRIRELAAETGVPIHSDPPTARALHASVEIGEQIPPDHYRAVAAAIRFAEDIRKRARRHR